MKVIFRSYICASVLLAVASLSYVTAASRAPQRDQKVAPALAMNCCDDPPPCGYPGGPPCPWGLPGN